LNILLTGASGFLGKAISQHLAFLQAHVLTIGRSNTNHIQCDLSLEVPSINKSNIELVIHSAGKAHLIPKNEFERDVFFDVNLKGTINLLKGLQDSNLTPNSFVFISSVSVYGLVSGNNITEDEPTIAQDSYGKSKIEAEKVILDWCKKNNVICTILRLPLLVGPNPLGNLKDMIIGIRKGFYFNLSGGNSRKSMVLASDVAKFIPRASEFGGTYNLTDGYHPSFYELSKLIASHYGRKYIPNMPFFIAKILAITGDILGSIFPINSNKLKKITSTLTFDDSKAREAFGWDPTPVLKGFKINE
jgi:nucleoside-diphosphate-sugar epimerase